MTLLESLSELRQRFFSERPPTDPRRERERVDKPRYQETFARAEAFARMGPPVDATLEPVSAPQNVQYRLFSAGEMPPEPSIGDKGVTRGLMAGRNALIQEGGWSKEEADRFFNEARLGDLSQEEFMRTVEAVLEESATSGRFDVPEVSGGGQTQPAERKPTADQKQPAGLSGAVSAAEDLARGNYREGRR